MKGKFIVMLWILTFLSGTVALGTGIRSASASTVHHVFPGESIQTAIKAASPSDTILVHEGTYEENIVIDKKLTLIGLRRPVINGGFSDAAVKITSDGVTFKGFKVVNGDPYGVRVYPNEELSIGVTLLNNIVTSTTSKNDDPNAAVEGTGIFVSGESYRGWKCKITIIGNKVVRNEGWGLYIACAEGETPYGIKIKYNELSFNALDGLAFETASNAIVERNIISDNGPENVGISIFDYSHDIKIRRNMISRNGWGGIWIDYRDNENIVIELNLIAKHRGYPGAGIEIEKQKTIVYETFTIRWNFITLNNIGIVLWEGPEENPYPKNLFFSNTEDYATSYD